ncbi:MAG: tetratricopeptide repeat protein [Myxococcales bacterium]|nr:tetratricopeptide repeat protein [Myxococcales bacterium]
MSVRNTVLLFVLKATFVTTTFVIGPTALMGQTTSPEPRLSPCDLYDPGIVESAPIVARGQFKRAFSLARAGRYVDAEKAFRKVLMAFEKNVQRLFHAEDGKVDNDRIQRFLANHVYGKDPELIVTNDDFRYVPTVYLTLAKVYCHTNNTGGATQSLDSVVDQQVPRLREGRAAIELQRGRPFEAIRVLEPAAVDDGVRIRLLRTLAMHSTGQTDLARAELDRAQTQCVGPVECGLVERLRAQIGFDGQAP